VKVNLFRTVVGIDPSGRRLALTAVRYGVGRPSMAVPPAVFEVRSEREQAWFAEAEGVLVDFVARNGLAGSDARLAIPADKVFLARIAFPPLKEKDLRPALELELDRLFPFPASRLKFNWRRSGDAPGGKGARQLVVAAPSEYLARWEELASRAGLSLAGAVPSGWALSAARRGAGEAAGNAGELGAILREVDGSVECTVTEGGEPFFSAVRVCPPGAAPAEAISLLQEALVDVSPDRMKGGIPVIAPSGWHREGRFLHPGAEVLRPVDGFESRAADAMEGPENHIEAASVWGGLGAYGAALAEKELDLLSPEKEGAGARTAARVVTGTLAAATLLLALSWPSAVALRSRQEVRRLDAEIASLRPAVERVEESLAVLGDIEGRNVVLRDARAGREEPLLVLRHLTERLPQGTWITGLRIEDRKVELDGLSPSANEIFPLLSRDGQFRKVEFASPITRQADNLERFQIRAEFVPVPPPKPVERGSKP
jgi:Tfp pilus assembly protein PilN